jgi:hypothetical protein
MNKFCTNLNIKLTPLKKEISLYGTTIHQRIPNSELNPLLLEFFRARRLGVQLAEMFYNPPHNISTIHIDSFGGDYSKINFVWGGGASVMNWYSINQNGVPSRRTTGIGTKSVCFLENEVELLHSQAVHSPSIVQVGVPHNITNGDAPRWCLSIVPVKVNGSRLTFDETTKIFKNLL